MYKLTYHSAKKNKNCKKEMDNLTELKKWAKEKGITKYQIWKLMPKSGKE